MTTPAEPHSESTTADSNLEPASQFSSTAGWMLRAARIRMRFVLIVAIVGIAVSQWSLLRAVWDRWTWSAIHTHAAGSVSSSHEYFCPMDPGVISAWPAICPICNMGPGGAKKMEAVMLPEGVIARMQLSPYRIQLAGIRTAIVEPRKLKFEQKFTGSLRKLDDDTIGFEVALSGTDARRFLTSQPAEIWSQSFPQAADATVSIVENSAPPRIRFRLDDSEALPSGSVVTGIVIQNFSAADGDVLSIPESAVVDRGRERLVYVETMPGQFDAVSVELSRRCGSYYPVVKGLKAGQRVASAGAFLIDAESRLNPSLAAGYFGANQSGSTTSPAPPPAATTPAPLPAAKSGSPKKTLSREDQALADRQRICPVTELPLNSMGGPISVIVGGKKVFICCSGCEKRLKDEPEKYLARISSK